MANATKAIPQKEEVRDKGPETPDAPLPLLDFSDAAVKKMIKQQLFIVFALIAEPASSS
jgi:hypothetical protein